MKERLKILIQKHSLLSNEMLDPKIFNDQNKLSKIAKEHSSLEPVVTLGKRYLYILKTMLVV